MCFSNQNTFLSPDFAESSILPGSLELDFITLFAMMAVFYLVSRIACSVNAYDLPALRAVISCESNNLQQRLHKGALNQL